MIKLLLETLKAFGTNVPGLKVDRVKKRKRGTPY